MEGVEFAPTTKFENERSNDDHMADTLIDLDGENPTTKSSSESMQKGQQDDRSMTGLLIDLADDTSPVIPGQGHGVTNIRLEEAPRGKSLFAIDGKAYEEDPEIQTSRERLAEMSIEVKASQPTRQKARVRFLATPVAPSQFTLPASKSNNLPGSQLYGGFDKSQLRLQPLQDLHDSRWAGHRYIHMADAMMDRRGGARGDFYNGGGYNRKRRRDDDDDNRPRFRDRAPLSVRLCKQILAIAESPLRDAGEDAKDFAGQVADFADNSYVRDSVSDLMPQMALEQPLKIPVAAAFLLHLNRKRRDVVALALEKLTTRIQTALEAGEWRSFKLLLRFLACVQSLFDGDGIFALLEELFNRAADLQAASQDDTVGPELVKIIMFTVPYAVAYSTSDVELKASKILEKTDVIASGASSAEIFVNPYVTTYGGENPSTQNALRLLQKQLQNQAEKKWELAFMARPFKLGNAETNGVDGEEEKSRKHAFLNVTIPQNINPGPSALFPEIFFSLYADQDIETVPPTSDLASSIIRDCLVDTLNILDFNRVTAGRFLVDLDCYFAPNTFVKRSTPFDKLRDIPKGDPTWKSEDLAVDAIFSQMLKLPSPDHKLVYYHSMVTETCKLAPAAIAPSLGRAIRFLYKISDIMDLELSYRFMDWFAHHLSNFDFRWKWTEWQFFRIDDVELSRLHPKKAFILSALDKEVRLSFAKRIRETLPEEYHPLIPATRDNDIPEYKYNTEQTPYSTEAKTILSLLKKKAADVDFDEPLTSITSAESARLSTDPESSHLPHRAAIDAFTTSLAYIGSKSFSHVLSYIERHKDRLLSFSRAHPALGQQIIASVVDYWRNTQPGVAVNIVDKLLNYTILTPASVVEWALLDETRLDAGRGLAESWGFEMVSGTVGKVTGRVRQIVAARKQEGLPRAQVDSLDQTLGRELQGMRGLFATIEDALKGVAKGSNDLMVEEGMGEEVGERQGGVIRKEEQLRLLKLWGGKWMRVFQRKAAVEERVVEETVKTFPPPVEEKTVEQGDAEVLLDADVDVGVNGGIGEVGGEVGGEVDADLIDVS